MGYFNTRNTLPPNTPREETSEYLSPACPGCRQHTLFVLDRWAYTAWLTGMPVEECFGGLSRADKDTMLTGWHSYCWGQRQGGPYDGTQHKGRDGGADESNA